MSKNKDGSKDMGCLIVCVLVLCVLIGIFFSKGSDDFRPIIALGAFLVIGAILTYSEK